MSNERPGDRNCKPSQLTIGIIAGLGFAILMMAVIFKEKLGISGFVSFWLWELVVVGLLVLALAWSFITSDRQKHTRGHQKNRNATHGNHGDDAL